jgi:glucose/arabinose dehydrogenase
MSKSKKFIPVLIISLVVLGLLAAACSTRPPQTPAETATPFIPSTSTTLPPTPATTETDSPTEAPKATSTPADVSSFPDPAGFKWAEVVSGLNRPVGVVSASDGSGRLFIIEQAGRILIYDGQKLLDTPFLDIRGRVGSSGSEQGLLGLAFPPDYPDSGVFYIDYTDLNGNTVVSRFQVSSDPNQASGDSEVRVLSISQPYQNHNGGHILFGPDGYLWIAAGDGGSAGDPQGNAQRTDNLLGKLLRVDVSQQPYTIPVDNPFGNEIWTYGLRNPWRFSFDPASGNLFIADVGQKKWEEVNYLAAGAAGGSNFGWNFREGNHPYEGTPPQGLSLIAPIWEYDHSLGCSISGGAVYRGSLAEWQGIYLYGDFCTGLVWGLLRTSDGNWANQQLFSTDRKIAAIDQGQDGEVYLIDLSGTVLKLTAR